MCMLERGRETNAFEARQGGGGGGLLGFQDLLELHAHLNATKQRLPAAESERSSLQKELDACRAEKERLEKEHAELIAEYNAVRLNFVETKKISEVDHATPPRHAPPTLSTPPTGLTPLHSPINRMPPHLPHSSHPPLTPSTHPTYPTHPPSAPTLNRLQPQLQFPNTNEITTAHCSVPMLTRPSDEAGPSP